jgi:protein-tyrosine phosphatase
MSRLHWIDLRAAGRIAIMARPRAGDWLESEIDAWKDLGIDAIVSLLEQEEISELALQHEAALCQAWGLGFISCPIPDRGVPESRPKILQLARSLAASVQDGCSVAIHCRAGIGRSSLMAACLMICSGVGAEDAFELIRQSRGLSVPDTDAQRDWVLEFGRFWRDEVFRSQGKPRDG